MGDVLTFTPRPKPTVTAFLPPLTDPGLRASLEEAAQTAFDAADRIIAVLDRMDGDADDEDGGDAEPSLAAPENHEGSQVGYMRGNDQDHEDEAPQAVLPEVQSETASPDMQAEVILLPWRGRSNVVATSGVTLLSLVGRES